MTRQHVARVWLECDHELWFPKPIPRNGEKVWCAKCQDYKTVGEPTEIAGPTLHPDYEWHSYPISASRFKGVCAICKEVRYGSFEQLRQTMEMHHIREHRNSSLIRKVESTAVPEILPANSRPPF